jgi:hypothetical protein
MFGSLFSKKKKKNLNEVLNKWKMEDDDNISDVSNSQEEMTGSVIQIQDSESSKSLPQKNLN